ncbi:unnamed protein product [Orchesella dallaii]|uniref:Uncharacterized protein n=1 Tax=Orchesella dallaii TaxID=48710 RepID=A0ABP1R9R8_9HEXA
MGLLGFPNVTLELLTILLTLVTLFNSVKGRREVVEITGHHLKLTTSSELSCDRISRQSRSYKLKSIPLSLLNTTKAVRNLHYDVAMSSGYLSAILEASDMNEDFRQKLEETGLCVNSTNLTPSNFTIKIHPGEDDILTVYFLQNLNITLGKENKSILLTSWKGGQREAVLHSIMLKVGNGSGSVILQLMCFLGEEMGMSVSIISTQPTFPMDNPTFMAQLKNELESDHNVTFSGIEDCIAEEDDRRSAWVAGLAIACFVSGVILLILYILIKIFKLIKLSWI